MERQDYVKYLGILIDKNPTWKYHIDYVASKISRTIGIIARLISLSTLPPVYRSLIPPTCHTAKSPGDRLRNQICVKSHSYRSAPFVTVQVKQLKTNPSLVIVFEQFERNKTFIHDTYKLLFIRVPFTKQSLIGLALRIDNFHAASKVNTETPQLRLSHS